MDKKRKTVTENFIRYTGLFLSIICFFIILIVAEGLNRNYNDNLNSNLNTFEEGWVLVDNSEEVSFPFTKGYSLDHCILKNKLKDVTDNDILLLKYHYQVKEIKIDGVTVYEFSYPDNGMTSTLLGTNILSISMKKDFSNKDIELVLGKESATKKIMIEDIYLCTRGEYLINIFKTNIVQLLVGSLLLITGAIYLIIYITIKIKGVKLKTVKEEYFLSLFVFSYSTALWVLTDVHLIFLLTGHLVVNCVLSYFSLSIVPIGLVYIVYYVLKKFRPFFIALEFIYCLNVLVQTILFTFGAVDLANMLLVTQILLFSGLFASIIVVILGLIKERAKDKILLIFGFALFLVLIGICIIGYVFGPIGFNYNLYFLFAMTILAFVFGYIVLKEFVLVMGQHSLMEQQIKYAYIDVLTGIGNRRAYEEAIVKEKTNIGPHHFSIVAFDVNYLKQSNDTLGHKAGDELLIAAASIIKKHLSEDYEENVFRTGGDEFAAILHISKEEIKERIKNLNEDIILWKGECNPHLSIAIGYAFKEDYPDISLEELAIKADMEMYKNKRSRHAIKEEDIESN